MREKGAAAWSDAASQYRRGAIMGLTVAESFMLISFMLLLLLALWQMSRDEQEAAATRLTEMFSQEQIAALAAGEVELSPVGSASEMAARLAEAEERARLVAEEDIRRLAEAAQELPPETRRALVDMVKLEDYREVLEQMETVRQLLAEGRTADDIRRSLEVVDRLKEGEAAVGITEREIAARIRERTGDLVADIGGVVEETGDVVLPDRVLFEPQSAQIEPEMRTFLQSFCRPWFEILREVGPQLAAVQIEGHASSEWGDLPPDQAYVQNLDLSQERARAVFRECLEHVGDTDLGDWARERLAAVGYSSSRPVLVDGQEDRAKSRRVVFGIDADRESITRALSGEPARPTPTDPRPDVSRTLEGGVTRIRDGDTIEIKGQAVRLQGLHVPELADPLGMEAKAFVSSLLQDRRVRCELTGEMSYDRAIGRCFLDGEDLAEEIIRNGYGRDCAAYSGGRYARFEPPSVRSIALPGYCS